jgi:N-acetylmuramoyl-L-alanine amidase
VGLQVGHWRHDQLPRELRWARRGGGGASAAGAQEWQVSLAIARIARSLLERRGIAVDLVPATVPAGYMAAAFVSIHADGNADPSVAGFKVAAASSDRSGLAQGLAATISDQYAQRTGLRWNTAITADMTNYYAFDRRRFRHAIDPRTPAVVIETGFLTSLDDRRVIVDSPALAAGGIADGVWDFLLRR